MKSFDYDLLVVGAGSGGVRASRLAASAGYKVGIIEHQELGGTCVNLGCIPKKLFNYSAHYAEEFQNAIGFGWKKSSCSFDWNTLLQNKNKEIQRLNGIYKNILDQSGVQLINGKAYLQDEHTLSVGKQTVTAQTILLAPGSKPFTPDIPGKQYTITSDEAFFLKKLPKKILIVGGGYIALEFASIFNGLGVKTTLCHRNTFFLKEFDHSLREKIHEELIKKGIQCLMKTEICKISQHHDTKKEVLFNNGCSEVYDEVMFATGRIPNVQSLGLENTNVQQRDNHTIIVNDHFQTEAQSIYAIGDVIGTIQLTPIAIRQAIHFVDHLCYQKKGKIDYSLIPTAVFTLPCIATVGLTEEQARQKYSSLDIYVSSFRPLKYTLTDNTEKTFMKLIVDKKSQLVLGCHMIGNDAAEIIQALAIALQAKVSKKVFDQTIALHPSSAEEWVTMREPLS